MGTALPLLVDTMIVIEAVRTGCWNAITGQRLVVTVRECADELQRGNPGVRGYIKVTDRDIDRLEVVTVSQVDAASFRLRYSGADGLDPGERELLAHAASRSDEFALCSADKAAVVAASAFGWLDRTVSLEAVAASVGVRPNVVLKSQFTETRMSQWRTSLIIGGPI